MDLASIELLKKLGSGVRPDGASPPKGAAALETVPFEQLMRTVQTGTLHSGRPVEISTDSKVRLEGEQLERLAVVVDAAEAAGTDRVVALLDGEVVSIDVPERRVDGANEELVGRVVTDLDGLIIVPKKGASELRALFAEGTQETSGAESIGPRSHVHNTTIASLLGTLAQSSEQADAPEENARAGEQRAA